MLGRHPIPDPTHPSQSLSRDALCTQVTSTERWRDRHGHHRQNQSQLSQLDPGARQVTSFTQTFSTTRVPVPAATDFPVQCHVTATGAACQRHEGTCVVKSFPGLRRSVLIPRGDADAVVTVTENYAGGLSGYSGPDGSFPAVAHPLPLQITQRSEFPAQPKLSSGLVLFSLQSKELTGTTQSLGS